jgi:hypothetical protein
MRGRTGFAECFMSNTKGRSLNMDFPLDVLFLPESALGFGSKSWRSLTPSTLLLQDSEGDSGLLIVYQILQEVRGKALLSSVW